MRKVVRMVSEGLGKYSYYEYFASNVTNKTTPYSKAKTKDVDNLLKKECHLIDLKIHPTIVLFMT